MNYEKYLKMENAVIPADIAEKLENQGNITAVDFSEKNKFLKNKELTREIGYTRLDNGDYLVSMEVKMPGVTKEMVDWWFWWHPMKKERYMLWYPGEHMNISYAPENEKYFNQKVQPPFEPNINYPIERIGGMVMPLSISFVTPEQFGYDKKLMKESSVATIICGHVGAFKDRIPHTEMSHIYFQEPDGLRLNGHFWIGARCKNPLLRKIMCTSKNAKGMAEHCYVEYTNLARKIPLLYAEYEKEDENAY